MDGTNKSTKKEGETPRKQKQENKRREEKQGYICEENEELLTPQETCVRYNICPRTVTNWLSRGKIRFTRTPGGHKRYICRKNIPLTNTPITTGRYICYARVSSNAQRQDLERQVEYLRDRYPQHEIITDIGSGINFKRKGFNTILDSAIKGNVKEIVVTYRDRLCRFGFEFVENIISKYSTGKVVVLNRQETSPEQELVDDLISIVTVFSSRIYGSRSHSVKNKIKEIISKEKETNSNIENIENEIISN